MPLPDPFPWAVITLAVGDDANDRFDAATAHFRREGEPVAQGDGPLTDDGARRALLRHVTGADKSDADLAASMVRLIRGGMCDEAAVRDLHGAEALWTAFMLAETGYAVVASMSVPDYESAAFLFTAAVGHPFDVRRTLVEL